MEIESDRKSDRLPSGELNLAKSEIQRPSVSENEVPLTATGDSNLQEFLKRSFRELDAAETVEIDLGEQPKLVNPARPS